MIYYIIDLFMIYCYYYPQARAISTQCGLFVVQYVRGWTKTRGNLPNRICHFNFRSKYCVIFSVHILAIFYPPLK